MTCFDDFGAPHFKSPDNGDMSTFHSLLTRADDTAETLVQNRPATKDFQNDLGSLCK